MPERPDSTVLDLVEPNEALEATFRSYVAEFVERNEKLIPFVLDCENLDFGVMVRRLLDDAKGINLPEGYVPPLAFGSWTAVRLWLVSPIFGIG